MTGLRRPPSLAGRVHGLRLTGWHGQGPAGPATLDPVRGHVSERVGGQLIIRLMPERSNHLWLPVRVSKATFMHLSHLELPGPRQTVQPSIVRTGRSGTVPTLPELAASEPALASGGRGLTSRRGGQGPR